MTRPQCGTPYGYKLHTDNNETTCSRCRKAHAEKAAERLRADPLAAAVHAWECRTRNAARRRLAREYQGRFLAILDEIRETDLKPVAEESEAA